MPIKIPEHIKRPELAKELKISDRSCRKWISQLRIQHPKEKALHRFIGKNQIFLEEDLGRVMDLCLDLNKK